MSQFQEESYRDMLVAAIKDAGQELIDRAEEMVSEDACFTTDFSINIDIPNLNGENPTITWHHSTLCTNYMNRMMPGIATRPSKKEPVKAYWGHTYDPRRNESRVQCSNCGYVFCTPNRTLVEAPDTCPECKAIMRFDT